MRIDFSEIAEMSLDHFYDGEKQLHTKMIRDEYNKIMKGRLVPGASIGMHTHETNSEIIFILEGHGKVLYDDTSEELHAGIAHYCKKGHAHSLINDSDADLLFYAVVPNQ